MNDKSPDITPVVTPDSAKSAAKADPTLTRLLKEFKYVRPLIGCRFDPTGRFAFTGAQDNLVQRWDLETGKATPLAGHESWVRAFACAPDGRRLFTGGYDGRIIFWDDADGEPKTRRTIYAHDGWVRGVALSPDGALLASCGNDNLVKFWDTASGELVTEMPGHASHVYAVLFHPAGQYLVSGDLHGNVKQWDVNSGHEVRQFSAPALQKYDTVFQAVLGGTRSLAFSADAKTLAASGVANVQNAFAGIGHARVVEFDWESGQEKKPHSMKEPVNGVGWSVRHHADGYWIGGAGGGGGGFLLFWKPDAEHEFFKFKLPNTLHDMDLHADGQRVAVAHADGMLRIWSMTAKPAG